MTAIPNEYDSDLTPSDIEKINTVVGASLTVFNGIVEGITRGSMSPAELASFSKIMNISVGTLGAAIEGYAGYLENKSRLGISIPLVAGVAGAMAAGAMVAAIGIPAVASLAASALIEGFTRGRQEISRAGS